MFPVLHITFFILFSGLLWILLYLQFQQLAIRITVLRDAAVGAPVFLTKNGRGRYAILDMQDFEKTQATIRLMNELAKGRKSGEEKGWLTLEAVEKNLGIVNE